ncbi:MAG: hypothetical protein HZC54_16145 [Verrucomicrobia bacterium]|nr:hypothetical protein [Verrucomicrobiota bacterium]
MKQEPVSLITRRRFLQSSLLAGAAAVSPLARAAGTTPLRIASFRFDVTPPVGHPLCGGWITPVVDCEDPLEAIGFVLLGAGKPIVVCVVDWTGILNEAHIAWRAALAEAAGTTPDRVAVQCVHQHDAPFVCLHSERLVATQGDGMRVMDVAFFDECLARARAAVKAALPQARPVTHVAHGEARVEKVASNRRIALGPDGKLRKQRGSSCKDPELIAMPEGLIDPMLKTVAFYDGAEKLVACHYYATHPMSHYGKGHVSSDFCGLARKRRQKDEPGCAHLYFNGAGGNIGAGKYNDGSPEARVQLTRRIYDGIVASERSLQPAPITRVRWKASNVLLPTNPIFKEDELRAMLADKKNVPANRIRPAMRIAWIHRVAKRTPIVLSALHVNNVAMLHMPAESFVEYQLRAQKMQPRRFVATAAYGDGGPWYIPVKEEYPKGGYEVSVANCAEAVDAILTRGMREALAG